MLILLAQTFSQRLVMTSHREQALDFTKFSLIAYRYEAFREKKDRTRP